MSEFIPLPLAWIDQRNAENWVIQNAELIGILKEASKTVVEVFNFLRKHGYDTSSGIRKALRNGEAYGIVRRTEKYPVHQVKIEVTDFGLEIYKMMLLGGIIDQGMG
ncbi:MAG: hypothetical protein JSV27_11385 [Candidatus Bathyarchaeota archaeon]|nr:MAG: hypothetical protein JSV27_11385 [Candidatus Bathyarchaeota archaeon]